MLSIAIPLYNKRQFIEKTIESCIHTCTLFSIEHEIVITNNASTDASNVELDILAAKHQNCRVIHLPHTISVGDNWLFALNNTKGTYLKLLLADDLMPVYDPNKAINLIMNSPADYAIGITNPVFEAKGFQTNYIELVNTFRKQLNPDLSAAQKAAMISEHIAHSSNPFGDIGALMFHRKCLGSLNLGVQASLPAFTIFPDLDIYLTLFANHSGAFLDETVSFYVFNDTSPAVRRETGSDAKLRGMYTEYEVTMPLHFLTALKMNPIVEHLSQEQKQLFLSAIQDHAAHLLGFSNIPSSDSSSMEANVLSNSLLWRLRTLVTRFARYLCRRFGEAGSEGCKTLINMHRDNKR